MAGKGKKKPRRNKRKNGVNGHKNGNGHEIKPVTDCATGKIGLRQRYRQLSGFRPGKLFEQNVAKSHD